MQVSDPMEEEPKWRKSGGNSALAGVIVPLVELRPCGVDIAAKLASDFCTMAKDRSIKLGHNVSMTNVVLTAEHKWSITFYDALASKARHVVWMSIFGRSTLPTGTFIIWQTPRKRWRT